MTSTSQSPLNGIPVAICAEDTPSAEAIGRLLTEGGLRVVGHVADHTALTTLPERPVVTVLVMPGVTRRAETIRAIRSQTGNDVVVDAHAAKGHEVRSALDAGAAGFVLEEERETTLVLTVRVAAAGQVAVPRRERRQVMRPTLSTREKQILGLVVMGYMNCEIGDQLYLAESTVKSHLSSAFSKLGVRSRNEAVDLILDGQDSLGRGILAITNDQPGPTARPQ